jgi:hypothetical protein
LNCRPSTIARFPNSLLFLVFAAWSPFATAKETTSLASWVRQLTKRRAFENFFDPRRGLAIIPANCGDNDEPQPRPRRICGPEAHAEMRALARQLRRRLTDIGTLSCRTTECVVSGTSEWDSTLHLSVDGYDINNPVVTGWFEVCAYGAEAEHQELVNRRRELSITKQPCP